MNKPKFSFFTNTINPKGKLFQRKIFLQLLAQRIWKLKIYKE